MNKQELIEKIKANGEWFETNRYVKITKAVELISQLNEPQKVKVPERVGKDLDTFTKARLKEDLVKDICLAVYDYSQGTSFDTSTVNWCRKGSNLRTMIDAIWNGYEVEEEPKWVVKYKPGNLENNWYFIGFYGGDRTLQPNCANRIDCDTVIKFKDRSKAEAVATLIDGTVEKV